MDKSIGIILYSNPDYYPPTINAIWLLQKKYKVIIFSRNAGAIIHSYESNTLCYRFGNNTSVVKSEKKNLLSKLIEYFLFIAKTVFYANRHNCKVIIVYDSYALIAAFILKWLNPKIKIFYHEHEVTSLDKNKKSSLSYWIKKVAYKNLSRCYWISQPDIKRVEIFQKHFNVSNVKLIRNFALKGYNYPSQQNTLCKEYKNEGYIIVGYIGTLGKGFYIDELIKYVESTQIKLLVVMAGAVRDENLSIKLEELTYKNPIGKIIHLDFLPAEEKYNLLNSIDFGLVLYSFEKGGVIEMSAGSSNKVGEYLAFGKPIIYPEWWDYESYYKEIGLSYKDSGELVQRIEQLASDTSLRDKLSENAKKLFNEKINFESEFEEMERMIDECSK